MVSMPKISQLVLNDAPDEDPPPYDDLPKSYQVNERSASGLTITARSAGGPRNICISIIPPSRPAENVQHVPCDLVLVIDVSGSMVIEAKLPGEQESTRLSILDLTKHAARTIVQSMDANDRLALVTFSAEVEVVQELTSMSSEAKTELIKKIEALDVHGATNLWGGLKSGLQILKEAKCKPESTRSLFLLTDGLPNHMCPSKGYIPSLEPMLEDSRKRGEPPIAINTFGFGYDIRSGLLHSIAEISGGAYAFIPDCGMIGTVFVHAVANLYSAYRQSVTLKLELPSQAKFRVPGGYSWTQVQRGQGFDTRQISIPLGSVNYGQTRHILVQLADSPAAGFKISTSLEFFHDGLYRLDSFGLTRIVDMTSNPLPEDEAQHVKARLAICDFLIELYPTRPMDKERQAIYHDLEEPKKKLNELIRALESHRKHDAAYQALLDDLTGPEPIGQVSLAFARKINFIRWGRHYLLSLFNAHQKQLCTSFKDPGPLHYGTRSPLFLKCRDELNDLFDNLPPPKPSIKIEKEVCYTPTAEYDLLSMQSFNSINNPCFTSASCNMVTQPGGGKIHIASLRPGMHVLDPISRCATEVAAIIKSEAHGVRVCTVGAGELEITPWHPIMLPGASNADWVFPESAADALSTRTYGSGDAPRFLYSVMLARGHGRVDSHQIEVGGVTCITLGHGKQTGLAAHSFLGCWDKVWQSVQKLGRDDDGRHVCGGVERDAATGLICGFLPLRKTG